MAMSTTLVGVAVFSVTRKRSVRIENVQMSMPLLLESKQGGATTRKHKMSNHKARVRKKPWGGVVDQHKL